MKTNLYYRDPQLSLSSLAEITQKRNPPFAVAFKTTVISLPNVSDVPDLGKKQTLLLDQIREEMYGY